MINHEGVSSQRSMNNPTQAPQTDLVQGQERGEEADILGEVRQDPEVVAAQGDQPEEPEQYRLQHRQTQDHTQKTERRHRRVVHAVTVV